MTEYSSVTMQSIRHRYSTADGPLDTMSIHQKVRNICQPLINKQGIYSHNVMKAAGFYYTNNGDTVRCDQCKLEVSDWTVDINPFTLHVQRSPACVFVDSLVHSNQIPALSTTNFTQSVSLTNKAGIACQRQKIETANEKSQLFSFFETRTLKEIRRRTFSHWSCETVSSAQMIKAGFFSCDVGDRVICLYCNIVCQQWVSQLDDPCHLHKIISPKCPYVVSTLTCAQSLSIPIVNGNQECTNSAQSSVKDAISHEQLVTTGACHVSYREVNNRYESFATWPNENVPSVDDLVRAGFFYTGVKTIVTCFYCNGSLKNWAPNDDPTIEHARCLPHCSYARQLCGEKQYRSIQMSKQQTKERHIRNQQNNGSATAAASSGTERSNTSESDTLKRLVAARLDLPMSQRMLDLNFSPSIVKRCWENQLRIKQDDFVSNTDLLVACQILQKQIKYIDGKSENIIIPATAMNQIFEREQREFPATKPSSPAPASINSSNNTDVEMATSSPSASCEITIQSTPDDTDDKRNTNPDSTPLLHPCAVCLAEEKCLACVPCGHLTTCVPCGHSLRQCPLCRAEIKAFVRVYL